MPLPFAVSPLSQGVLNTLQLTSVAAKRRESDNFQKHPEAVTREINNQEILEKTNHFLSFCTTRTAYKTTGPTILLLHVYSVPL
jgi:hypothetical protein